MKVKRMGITEILRKIWLFSANKTKLSQKLICKKNSSAHCAPLVAVVKGTSKPNDIVFLLSTFFTLYAERKSVSIIGFSC